jgi:uncharacterized protein YgiM (DUF1202 family)
MAQNQKMSVQVQDGKLRADPSFLGKILGSVAYGESVTFIKQQDPWVYVSAKGGQLSGWIHNSALSEKEIVLRSGSADVAKTASQKEVALAGKGFNADVEKEFKTRNPKLNFEWVDRMEKFVVSDEEIRRFIKEGTLSPQGGAS